MSNESKQTAEQQATAAVRSSDGLAVDPLVGAMYRGSDGAMTCAKCNCEMEWEECSSCGGDGGFDGYEDDPLWYQPGELAPCPSCNSEGGSWWCETEDCPTNEGWKKIPAPKTANDPSSATRPPNA